MNINPLLQLDIYKLGHQLQYPDKTEYVYSYLEARKPDMPMVFYGLQYYIKEYITKPLTQEHLDEFLKIYKEVLGDPPKKLLDNMSSLVALGHWPLEIRALPEGFIYKTKTPLITIVNTIEGFGWCVGYLESLLLKVWNICTVATFSAKYRALCEQYAVKTCDDLKHIPYQVNDFGYRGVSSEETAFLGGSAHFICFKGSDNLHSVKFVHDYYGCESNITTGANATEHSVMCAYGRDELFTFNRMLDIYPEGLVSIVADTYDYFKILTEVLPSIKDRVLNRAGKLVVRPDTGNPEHIILGDPEAEAGTPEHKGSLNILWDTFGGTYNSKGFKVLDSHIGLIYGDAIYYDRFERILKGMEALGFATSNLVVGVGGLLLQSHSRDDLAFAIKASAVQLDGQYKAIMKDPKTDQTKKSKTGIMDVRVDYESSPITYDSVYSLDDIKDKSLKYPMERNENSLLEIVYVFGHNDIILKVQYKSFDTVRDNFELMFAECKQEFFKLEKPKY